jgi:hypothetical protein
MGNCQACPIKVPNVFKVYRYGNQPIHVDNIRNLNIQQVTSMTVLLIVHWLYMPRKAIFTGDDDTIS